MQSPAAFPWLHTCARCIMCRLCLVAERWRCSYGLSMIDGWAGVPALEALPCPVSRELASTRLCTISLFSSRRSCQVSQNSDYLSPETNLRPGTSPSWSFAPL